jgi:hypothetical protein
MAKQNKAIQNEDSQKLSKAIEDIKKLSREECEKLGLPYYDESKHWVRFSFLEQPGQRLDFTFGKTVYNPRKISKKGTEHEKYSLKDGEVYKLPQYIIDHLHSKVVPDPIVEKGPHGQIRANKKRMRNRFALAYVPEPIEGDKALA